MLILPLDDTIAARATASGPGAVAIVRCSGPGVHSILARCFEPVSKAAVTTHRVVLGHWRHPETLEHIDTVLAVRMDGPHSFTGQDVLEVHCHGGIAVIEAVLDAMGACGARPAGPGEFTRRAFLNGRLDLTQAEAIGDLVQARTAQARRVALRQLHGRLSSILEAYRRRLINAIAELEAYLDFPEEELPAHDGERIIIELESLASGCLKLSEQGLRGRVMREGARAVLAGPPNAGKSSLFNYLVGHERALVSPHPGTTRDTIESTIDLMGLAVTLIDTAGIRTVGAEEIERMGIEKATGEIRGADVAVWLTDISTECDQKSDAIDFAGPEVGRKIAWIRVGTKADQADPDQLDSARERFDFVVSSTAGHGVEDLEQRIYKILMCRKDSEGMDGEDVLVSNRRHIQSLVKAAETLRRGAQDLRAGISSECAIVDLRAGLQALSDVLGVGTGDEVLDAIFNRFCIGK